MTSLKEIMAILDTPGEVARPMSYENTPEGWFWVYLCDDWVDGPVLVKKPEVVE